MPQALQDYQYPVADGSRPCQRHVFNHVSLSIPRNGNEHLVGQHISPWEDLNWNVFSIKEVNVPPPSARPTHKRTSSPLMPFDSPSRVLEAWKSRVKTYEPASIHLSVTASFSSHYPRQTRAYQLPHTSATGSREMCLSWKRMG